MITSIVRFVAPFRCPIKVFSGCPTPSATADRLSWSKPATTSVSLDSSRTRWMKLLVLTSGASMLLPPDEIVFMHKGRVWETGPASILDAPATTELRDFVGNGL